MPRAYALILALACGLVTIISVSADLSSVARACGDDPCVVPGQSVNLSVERWFEHLMCQIPMLVTSGRDLGLVEVHILGGSKLRLEDEQPYPMTNGGLYEVRIEKEHWRSSTDPFDHIATKAGLFTGADGKQGLMIGGDGDDSDLFLMPGDRVLAFIERAHPIDSSQPPQMWRELWWLRKALIIRDDGYLVIAETYILSSSKVDVQGVPEFGVAAPDKRTFSEPVDAGEAGDLIADVVALLEAESTEVREPRKGVD